MLGVMAKVCIAQHIGYLGICHKIRQKEHIGDELTTYVLSQMSCPTSRLYNAAYGKLLSSIAVSRTKDTSTGSNNTKPEKDEKEGAPEEDEDIHDEEVERKTEPKAKQPKAAAAKKKTKDGAKDGDRTEPKVPKSLADMLAAAKARMSSGAEA